MYQGKEVPSPSVNGTQVQQQLRSGLDQLKSQGMEQLGNVDVQIQLKPQSAKGQ
jgi:hypothetical protein